MLTASLALWLLSVVFRVNLNRAVALATVGSTVVALVTIWTTSWQASPAAGGPESAVRAAGELARAVRGQWQREASAMGIQRPGPLLVRWSLSELGNGTSAANGATRRRADQPWLTGDVTELPAAFRSLPSPHLVVLGPAGSGKTVLALLTLLEFAADWHDGEAVPVFLSVASWNPEAEQFSAWVKRSLLEHYPTIASLPRYGGDAAGQLVESGRLLLVLDGLDELPERIRSAAVTALDTVTRVGQQLILTCRSDEYRALEAASGYPPLGLASVAELDPLGIDEADRYLRSRSPAGSGQRWGPVIDQARRAPRSALARALSVPLMVYLAGTAYGVPSADPADLIGISRSGESVLEAHLLDLLIPTLYGGQPARDLVNENLSRYSPGQAREWLAFLARHLDHMGTPDLEWWRLTPAVRNWRVVSWLAFGVLYGTTVGLAAGVMFGPYYGLAAGISYGAVIGFVYGSDDSATPQRVSFSMSAIASHFRDNLAGGVLVGATVGLAAGVAASFFSPLRSATAAALAFGGVGVLMYVLMSGLRAPLDEVHAVGPQSVLAADRAAVLLYRLVMGVTYSVLGAVAVRSVLGLRGGIAFGLAVALAQGFAGRLAFKRVGRVTAGSMSGGAWFRFSVARCWLALRGDLPWRLMGFLHDARTRGLLRQSGAAYQFRHPRLRERLGGSGQPGITGQSR